LGPWRSYLGVEPLLERRAGQDRVRAGEEGAVRDEPGVRVGRIAELLDPCRVTAAGGEQRRHLGEVLLTRAGDFQDAVARRLRLGAGRERRERLRDGPCGYELRAHPRQVAHVALPAPRHELLDELVELSGAQDACGDRSRLHGLLVGDLRGLVAPGESVGPDDRDDHHAPHAGALAGLLQVPGRGGEELGGLVLVGRAPGRGVDHDLDAGQRFREAVAGHEVDAAGARHRDDVVAPGLEQLDDVTSHPSGRAGDRNPLARFHDCSFSIGPLIETRHGGRM
jgi:hypothetical protein